LVDVGARLVNSLAELAADCDVLTLCVGDDADVRAVMSGTLDHLQPNATVVIHSTVSPWTCTELGEVAAERGVAVVDAPVSGGRSRAIAGDLTLMVGGAEVAVTPLLPLWREYASSITHLGPLGSGQKVKLVNNYLLAAQAEITARAVSLLEHLAVPVPAAMGAIATSTGRSFHLERFVERGFTDVFGAHQGGAGRGAALLEKDVSLMGALLEGTGGHDERLEALALAGVRRALDAVAPID
jgi:3-hydroxyisobutyrate dehydrogenase-like beta-hydroxyacid dehydrogenase